MKIIIDRIEGNIVVAELPDGKTVQFVKELLPPEAHEGSVITLFVDDTATEERANNIKKKMNDLFKD